MEIENCTCGINIGEENTLIDSLYPMNRERTEWNFCCQLHNMGCGRTVYGKSKDDVIQKWNNGVVDEMDVFTEEDEKRIQKLIDDMDIEI